jgi:hypothetical protein
MACPCVSNNKSLREALDAPDGFLISQHRDYIERVVRSAHPHTVVFRDLIDESTCVLYAFGLVGNWVYRAVALNFDGQIFAGRGFMEWLIQGHLVEIDNPREGCLALYFDNGAWMHVGVVADRLSASTYSSICSAVHYAIAATASC